MSNLRTIVNDRLVDGAKLDNLPSDLNASLLLKEDKASKGVANGYASLGSDGKVPSSQLPSGTGSGNVIGPSSSTDGNIVTFDGATGTSIKDSGVPVVSGVTPGTYTAPTVVVDSYGRITSATNGSVSGGTAAGTNVYLTNSASSTVGSYKALSYTDDVSPTSQSTTVTASEALIKTYLFDLPVGVTSIPAGPWSANFNAKVSRTAGVSTIKMEVFVRASGGTETTLFSKYTDTISSTSYANYPFTSNQGLFSVSSTDKVGVRIYGKTTSGSAITITYQVGNDVASWFTTPIPLRHELLRELAWTSSGHTGTASAIAGFDGSGNASYKVAGTDFVSPTGTENVSNKTITASTVNGVTLSTAQGTSNFLRGDGTYAAPSGGGAQMVVTLQDYKGSAMDGYIGEFTAPYGMTLAEVTPGCVNLPVGSNLIFELRKTSDNSNILSSTCQVTTTESATNNRYLGTPVTSFTSGSIGDGMTLYGTITSKGSTLPAYNPFLILRFSA